ncbi:hypothetical protein ACFQ7F_34750 [Streptomyces sp. NPDC056486]|uniref:hypothetical protein n=1 Tax=Streptomyces sp. NPDC056486 TaxID=3345835 RepID=UPI0036C236D7
MTDIWVLGPSSRFADESTLVRTDDITDLATDGNGVTATLRSQKTLHIVHQDHAPGKELHSTVPPVPGTFHIALLVKISKVRQKLNDGDEDQILMADLDDDGAWDWGGPYPVSDLA